MWTGVLTHLKRWAARPVQALQQRFVAVTHPPVRRLILGTACDTVRSKSALIAENALLRQQLNVMRRQVARPRVRPLDRLLLVLLVRCVRAWRDALLIVQPDTLLRWHRAGLRLVWRAKSRATSSKPKILLEIISAPVLGGLHHAYERVA